MTELKRPEIKIGMFYYFSSICDLDQIKTDADVRDAYEEIDDWFDEYKNYEKLKFFDSWDDVLKYFKGHESDEEINYVKVKIFVQS